MRERRRRSSGRRRALVTMAVAGGVVAMITGGPWVYAQLLAPEAPPPLTAATTVSPPPTPQEAVDPEGTWTVAEGSVAGYRLGEVLSGQDVVVVGRTEQVTGTLDVQGGELVSARVLVDVASITTPESARDAYFRRAMDTSTHPEAVFELAGPVDVSAVGRPGQDVSVELTGTLTLRGTAVPVTVQAVARVVDGGLEVTGSTPVTLADFGLTAPELPFVTVEPTGTVEVQLRLER